MKQHTFCDLPVDSYFVFADKKAWGANVWRKQGEARAERLGGDSYYSRHIPPTESVELFSEQLAVDVVYRIWMDCQERDGETFPGNWADSIQPLIEERLRQLKQVG